MKKKRRFQHWSPSMPMKRTRRWNFSPLTKCFTSKSTTSLRFVKNTLATDWASTGTLLPLCAALSVSGDESDQVRDENQLLISSFQMVLGVGLGRVSSTGRWSEFSQLLIFPPKISIVSHNFRQLQLWTGGEGYAGWSSANRWRWVKSRIVKIFSRLTERATWPGGSRLQISGGGRAGKSGWYFHQTQSIFSGSRQMSPNKFFSTTRSSSDSRLFL